jgi:hypothetical protein
MFPLAWSPKPFFSVLKTSIGEYSIFWNLLFEHLSPSGQRGPLIKIIYFHLMVLISFAYHSIISIRLRQSSPHPISSSSTGSQSQTIRLVSLLVSLKTSQPLKDYHRLKMLLVPLSQINIFVHSPEVTKPLLVCG